MAEDFLIADIDDDGLLDFVFRSATQLYVYQHDGIPMGGYPVTIQSPTGNGGARFGAADVDGDGHTEIVAIDASNTIHVLTGYLGDIEHSWPVSGLLADQRIGHIAIANLRGEGDHDAIIQTTDVTGEESGNAYYINRSLIAMNLTDGSEIWSPRIIQNNSTYPTIYEGYWGQAHGPFFSADIDFDGLDEVVGGNLIESDGSIIDLGYPMDWISANTTFIDHLDAIGIGDIRSDKPGLEWGVTEEDWIDATNEWNTTAIFYNSPIPTNSILWREETLLFPDGSYREPQNLAIGNYDTTRSHAEIWISSRFGNSVTSQHPWIFSADGTQIADYTTESVLPGSSTSDYFNQHPDGYNKQGLDLVCTIDWDGGPKEYIAAKTRHISGNVGVFDAMTGKSVWHTGTDPEAVFDPVQARMIYVADVAGDSREEVIVCDESVSPPRILIYWNENDNPNPPKQNKWDDPLYRRVKQNWNYYSPGSYTQPAPAILQLRVFLEGPYVAAGDTMRTALLRGGVIPLQSPFPQDPAVVAAIPSGVVDWVLIELRKDTDGDAVISRSVFLGNDGRVIDTDGSDTGIPLFIIRGKYYIVLKHRNHLGVMSAEPLRFAADSTSVYDFTASLSNYYGERAKLLETGVYGLYTGDANSDGQVKVDDKNDFWWIQVGRAGYWSGDFNLDGQVKVDDKNDFWWKNVGIGSQVPLSRPEKS